MKKVLLGTNLKMYKGIAETTAYLEHLQELTGDLNDRVRLFVIPSYTSLPAAVACVKEKQILLGAQNMHPEEKGQFTGEISPLMLKELKIDIVEIGHSERRQVFGESDEEENKKVLSALQHGFTALLCVGETALEKEQGISEERLRIQLKICLQGVEKSLTSNLWIAYEPVWAIGVQGVPAEPEYVQRRHADIKKMLEEIFPGNEIPVLYGGSVNPANAAEFLQLQAVEGLFIGRAAWDADKFNDLMRQVLPVWEGKI